MGIGTKIAAFCFPYFSFPLIAPSPYPIGPLIWATVFAPLWEELIYRKIPIEICRKTGIFDKISVYLWLGTSILFGLGHGGTYSIVRQGLSGLVFFKLCEKRGYFSVVLAHGLYNFLVIYLFPLINGL